MGGHLKEDLSGRRFGRLTVKEYMGAASNYKWRCLCDCGRMTLVQSANLTSGNVRSCGCLQKERASEANTTHGLSGTRLYNIYRGIITRCLNPRDHNFKKYGKNGITICEEWAQSFEAFAEWAHENGYAENLTIDRIDNDKGYSPDNCRWAGYLTQGRNRRNVRHITYKGKTMTYQEWGKEIGISFHVLRYRILKKGWSVEKAFTVPVDRNGEAAKKWSKA